MIDFTLILEVLTAAAVAFITYRQHTQIKTNNLLSNFQNNSVQPITSNTSNPEVATLPQQVATPEIIVNGIKVEGKPRNIKQELQNAASLGLPFDATSLGAGAIINVDTGDVTYAK